MPVIRRPHSTNQMVVQGKCPLDFVRFNGAVCSNTLFSKTSVLTSALSFRTDSTCRGSRTPLLVKHCDCVGQLQNRKKKTQIQKIGRQIGKKNGKIGENWRKKLATNRKLLFFCLFFAYFLDLGFFFYSVAGQRGRKSSTSGFRFWGASCSNKLLVGTLRPSQVTDPKGSLIERQR